MTIESVQIQTPPIDCEVANCADEARCRLHYTFDGFSQTFVMCLHHTRETVEEGLANVDG